MTNNVIDIYLPQYTEAYIDSIATIMICWGQQLLGNQNMFKSSIRVRLIEYYIPYKIIILTIIMQNIFENHSKLF